MVRKKEILDKLSHRLAGRVAEEIRFDDITTGATNDLQRVTETARRMITQYGMSEKLGPLTFGHDPGQPFLGRDYGMGQEYSDETALKIDMEIRRVVDEAYGTAKNILTRAPRRSSTRSRCCSSRRRPSTASSSRPSSAATTRTTCSGPPTRPRPARPPRAPAPSKQRQREQQEGPAPEGLAPGGVAPSLSPPKTDALPWSTRPRSSRLPVFSSRA